MALGKDNLYGLPPRILRRLGLSKYFNYTLPTNVGGVTITIPITGGSQESLLFARNGVKRRILTILNNRAD
jgi:hypothetical protein